MQTALGLCGADEPAEGLGDASFHVLHGGVGCVVGAERVRGCFDGAVVGDGVHHAAEEAGELRHGG